MSARKTKNNRPDITSFSASWEIPRRVVLTLALALAARLQIISLRGRQEFLYSDLDYRQGVALRPPRWLIILSYVAAFAGRGAAQTAGQMGRAMILDASQAGGWYLKSKDNRSAYVWFTDQMGSIAMKNLKRLTQALEAAQVPLKEEVIMIRRIFPPTS